MTLTLEKDHQDQGEREKYLFSEYFTSQFLFFRSNLSSQLCINSKKDRNKGTIGGAFRMRNFQ